MKAIGSVEIPQEAVMSVLKLGGKPCIRGMLMTVYDVLDYLASGMTQEEILADFPNLTAQDIQACLAFAANRERRLIGVTLQPAPFH